MPGKTDLRNVNFHQLELIPRQFGHVISSSLSTCQAPPLYFQGLCVFSKDFGPHGTRTAVVSKASGPRDLAPHVMVPSTTVFCNKLCGCAKGAAKASCGETVVQKGVFGESVSSLPP